MIDSFCQAKSRRRGNIFRLFLLFILGTLTACAAQYPLNPVVKPGDIPWEVERYERLYDTVNDYDPLILILAFSGGGTRAASLAYGTLEALQRVDYTGGDGGASGTMLDHVSLITSVSGGSFTAAYYGLHGEAIFDDFRERFLVRNVQGDLVRKFINPFQWFRLASPRFGRSDLAQEYYDRILFDGATLGEIGGDDRPAVAILATEVVAGMAFPFIPDIFELICSDFMAFPVSRAVAASSAFPGALSPVILKNYAGTCQDDIPEWISEAMERPDPRSRIYQLAQRSNAYLDREEKPYIYLIDGGVSDNLGLRTIIEKAMIQGGIERIIAESEWEGTARVAFIIVDAETHKAPPWIILGEIPGIRDILGMSSSVFINKYNFETLDLLRRMIADWQIDNESDSKAPEFYQVHLTFNSLQDREQREYFNAIPTTFSLEPEQVDQIRAAAERLLYGDPEFRRLLDDIGGRIVNPGARDE